MSTSLRIGSVIAVISVLLVPSERRRPRPGPSGVWGSSPRFDCPVPGPVGSIQSAVAPQLISQLRLAIAEELWTLLPAVALIVQPMR